MTVIYLRNVSIEMSMRDNCYLLEECVSLPAELFIPEEVPEQQVRADSRLDISEGQNMGLESSVINIARIAKSCPENISSVVEVSSCFY